MIGHSDVAQLGTILGIWAHPDDESWVAAGLMHLAVKNGQRVASVTATYGEGGETADPERWPHEQLGVIRRRELARALEVIGVKECYVLEYPDGKLNKVNQAQAIKHLAGLIKSIKPNTIITFGPDGLTGHQDHKQIHTWSVKANQLAGLPATVYSCVQSAEKYQKLGKMSDDAWNIYFATDQPYCQSENEVDICIKLDKPLLTIKCRAYQAHASQTAGMLANAKDRQMIAELMACECFERAA